MKKIALTLAATALVSLAACSKPAPPVENTATSLETNLTDQASALDNQVGAAANDAAANTVNSATATYTNKVDSIRAEAEAAKKK